MMMILFFLALLSDEDFSRLKRGHPDVFEKIYTQYKKLIYNFFQSKIDNRHDIVENLFSETFCKALESVKELRNQKNIK